MVQLLQIEWLKIRKYKTFWILCGLFAALLLSVNLFISNGIMKLGTGDLNILNRNYTFPEVWGNVAFWTKIFSGLLAIIIIILTTNEYQFKTNRQNVIDGWSRLQFYHAKWLLLLVLGVVVTFYTFLLGLFLAFYHGSSSNHLTENLEKLIYIFTLTINYFGFALTLSIFLKRSGVAILIFLIYTYVIEQMLNGILNAYLQNGLTTKPGNFLPLQSSAELLNFPLTEMFSKMIAQTGPSHLSLFLGSIFWIAVYYFVGRLKLEKTDW